MLCRPALQKWYGQRFGRKWYSLITNKKNYLLHCFSPTTFMGRGAIKARRQAAKAKKKAVSPSSPPPPPPSPPSSPPDEDIHAEMDVETHTAAETRKGPEMKERRGPRIAPSDRVTRFHGVLGDTSSRSTSGDAGRVSGAKAASKPSQPQEISTSKGDETSGEPRPVRQSSVAIRTLLQQISSLPNAEEDSPAYSGGEDEGESIGNEEDKLEYCDEENYSDGSGNKYNSNDDDNGDEVEIVAPKKVVKVSASRARKKPVQVTMMHEDESKSEDDENGEFDSL